jgi:polysaccharide pyruvyl transferase WcaK-like protein
MFQALRALAKSLAIAVGRRKAPMYDPYLVIPASERDKFRAWGFYDETAERRPRILISSGFGYGNVGDEAQVGACASRWLRAKSESAVTLLSPNPSYTAALHRHSVEWAPRVAWFRANTGGPYFDDPRFCYFWKFLRFRLEITARCMRGDLPFSLCTPRESRILQLIQEHDIIHISGGGFLTGKTRSRLWDNCLLMRMCQILGKPYMLTGHNIGVFQDAQDRKIARMGLSKAMYIGLRDKGISEAELVGIGIKGSHVSSTCDDALFCDRLDRDTITALLAAQGADPSKPWVAVNFHHWGQKAEERSGIEDRFAEICDRIVSQHGLEVVLISMTPSDVEPEANILQKMKQPAVQFPYSPDYRVVRGIIADSSLVFTMKHHPIVFAQGECVPVVSVALDSYYLHKNKGALDNTGDGRYLANSDDFTNDNVLSMIEHALGNQQEIRERMKVWIESMRNMELDPYNHALKSLGSTR